MTNSIEMAAAHFTQIMNYYYGLQEEAISLNKDISENMEKFQNAIKSSELYQIVERVIDLVRYTTMARISEQEAKLICQLANKFYNKGFLKDKEYLKKMPTYSSSPEINIKYPIETITRVDKATIQAHKMFSLQLISASLLHAHSEQIKSLSNIREAYEVFINKKKEYEKYDTPDKTDYFTSVEKIICFLKYFKSLINLYLCKCKHAANICVMEQLIKPICECKCDNIDRNDINHLFEHICSYKLNKEINITIKLPDFEKIFKATFPKEFLEILYAE